MAFVYRADRSLDFAKREHKNLGPGAYLGHGEFRPKHLYDGLHHFLVPTHPSPPSPNATSTTCPPSPPVPPILISFVGPGQYAPPGQFDVIGKKPDQEGKAGTSKEGKLAGSEWRVVELFVCEGATAGIHFRGCKIQGRTAKGRGSRSAVRTTFVGPGAYNPRSEVLKKEHKAAGKAEWQQMAMVRLPNAPSIPSHNNIYGYEETPGNSSLL